MARMISAVAFAAAGSLLLAAGAAAQTHYSIKRVGPAPGDLGSFAGAINNAGQATGWSTGSGADRAFFSEAGSTVALPDLGAPLSYGRGISPAGEVVGLSPSGSFPFYEHRASLWTRDDDGTWHVTDLGLLPVHAPLVTAYSEATAISGAGLIVGASADGYNTDLAAVWELDHSQNPPQWVIAELPGVPGAFYTVASAVNGAGQAVGRSDDAALLWTKDEDGTWVATPLGGLPGGDGWADARGINAGGVIVGQAGAPDGQRHAVRWDADGIADLGPEGMATAANAVNAGGVIVGWGAAAGPGAVALRWSAGAMHDLQTLIPPGTGWSLIEAVGINDAGQILGSGFLGGWRHTFLLTPADLGLTGPTPGSAGEANSFTVSGAGGAGFVLWCSFSGGETALTGCGDVPLNLGSPVALLTAAPGVTTVTLKIPDAWSGRTVYFQASAASGCSVSNVVEHTFP